MKLSESEEELMRLIWKLGKAYMSELLELYPDPKPAATTVATLLKRMQDKGVIDFEQHGRSRQYFALVKESDYSFNQINGLIGRLFNNSATKFASFFTTETGLSEKELEELKKIVEKEIKRKKK